MPVWTEMVRQSQVEHDRRWPLPVTGLALVARHVAAVEGVIAYRAMVKRDVANNARPVTVGISIHHYHNALRSLIATRRLLADANQVTRIAALDQELSVCENTAGDAFTLAARGRLHGRMIERYADLMLPGAVRVRESAVCAAE